MPSRCLCGRVRRHVKTKNCRSDAIDPSQNEEHIPVGRPYSRTCPLCSQVYVSKSNSRVYCYKCSPANVSGGGSREDGQPSGMEQETPSKIRNRKKRAGSNVLDHDRIPSREGGDPDRTLDPAIAELAVLESRTRATGKDEIVFVNPAGDETVALGRPKLGWGKCKHIDPSERVETCVKERWSETTPFCREHVVFWRDKRESNKARKVLEEEVSQFEDLSKANFFFKSAQDIMDFLSRLNFAVYKNWIPVGKARALSAIARVQIKALDSKIIAHRLHAILLGLNKGQGGTSIVSQDDLESLQEDIEQGRALGLNNLVDLVDKTMRDPDGNGRLGPGTATPKLTREEFRVPDPALPEHPEDSVQR